VGEDARPVRYSDAPATMQAFAQVPAGGRSPWDDAMPDLRNKIVNKLISMNWNQTVATWQRRRRDPLNPHVLVFFFANPPSGWPARSTLRVAARLFPGGDEQRLAMLLYELTPVVRAHVTARRNLDKFVFSWADQRSPQARYVGVGVSSLDTPAGSWDEVQKSAQSDMEVPGRCYAHLVDGSMLLIDRLARRQFGECHIWSNHSVRDVSGERHRPTTTAPDIATSDTYGPQNRAVWQWLAALNSVMAEGLHHDH